MFGEEQGKKRNIARSGGTLASSGGETETRAGTFLLGPSESAPLPAHRSPTMSLPHPRAIPALLYNRVLRQALQESHGYLPLGLVTLSGPARDTKTSMKAEANRAPYNYPLMANDPIGVFLGALARIL